MQGSLLNAQERNAVYAFPFPFSFLLPSLQILICVYTVGNA